MLVTPVSSGETPQIVALGRGAQGMSLTRKEPLGKLEKKEDTQCLLPPEELIFPVVSPGPQLLEGELRALAQ